MLATTRFGTTGSPIVAVHGFTQSAQAWERPAAALGRDWRVVAVDAPGHGGSSAVRADLWAGADAIAAAAGRGTYLGYSMGGRFVLHVALAHPEVVERLVLVSATAGLDTEAERTDRRAADEQLARRIERDGVEEFVGWWLERPLFAGLPPEDAALDSRLGNTVAGLASSLRLAGTGTQEPLWDRLGELRMPVLVMAGERDEAYRTRAERLAMAVGAPATLAIVAGAGHACHLEACHEWAARLRRWLKDET